MKSLLACLLFSTALTFSSAAMAAPDEKPMTHAEVEALVKKVIADNPDLIFKAVQDYQIKQQADSMAKTQKKIASMHEDLAKDPLSPAAGNPKGDVTVVEFFDYHCGYCKHFYPIVSQLLDEDSNVHFVFKEFPILSEDSETAARAALAVNHIDKSKYFGFHSALMKSSGQFTMESLIDTAKEAGISEVEFRKALQDASIDKELEKTKSIAQELNISGTPMILVNNQFVPGAVDLKTLKERIAKARAEN